MLTDPKLRSQVDALWDKLWTGGLSNPLDAIEQLSFLLFLKRLDEAEQDRERDIRLHRNKRKEIFPDPKLRWSYWTNLKADDALKHVKEKVFPFLKALGGSGGSFAEQMANAEFKINKPSLLIEACKAIDAMHVSEQNQDVQGDLYEYLLGRLNTAGTSGQFRTPRHIIRMMVKMLDPKPRERMCDPAAGTCGFPVNFYQHILETHTDPAILKYDEEGYPHPLIGDKLTKAEHDFLQAEAITAYDSDSGMTMLRIGSMNLMLHGIERPRFHYKDTLSKSFNEEKCYDVVLANPPFKGAIDSADVNPTLPTKCKKTEILFLHLFLRLLEMGGRGAVIVPDGVLFGTSNAHVEIRKKLIEENRLDAVVSMPGGVFKPYAGVSTAVLLFTKGGTTDKIWFYDMEHDGFSLDDKRQRVSENDIPDILECWKHRRETKFAQTRAQRLDELQKEITPLKAQALKLHAEINRLTFEAAIASESSSSVSLESSEQTLRIAESSDDKIIHLDPQAALEADQKKLEKLHEQMAPLQNEINQLNRQFWVSKDKVKTNKYDLSASRYRQIEQEEVYYEKPEVT
ncbi:MAG: type I restriction-modification system subunit M, partial [Chthoniobacterales bacterium]